MQGISSKFIFILIALLGIDGDNDDISVKQVPEGAPVTFKPSLGYFSCAILWFELFLAGTFVVNCVSKPKFWVWNQILGFEKQVKPGALYLLGRYNSNSNIQYFFVITDGTPNLEIQKIFEILKSKGDVIHETKLRVDGSISLTLFFYFCFQTSFVNCRFGEWHDHTTISYGRNFEAN